MQAPAGVPVPHKRGHSAFQPAPQVSRLEMTGAMSKSSTSTPLLFAVRCCTSELKLDTGLKELGIALEVETVEMTVSIT